MRKLHIALDTVLLASILCFSVAVFLKRDQLSSVTPATYPGIILLCFLSNVTVFLPSPSLMVVAAFSLVLNPPLVALCGALGSSLGELSGYLTGAAGCDLSPAARTFCERISTRIKKDSILVFVLALLPLPLFDAAGVYSGGRSMQVWKFFLCCFCGKFIKSVFYAYFYFFADWLSAGAFKRLLPL